ncbi:MAG: carboxypeptidase regulatory-like domain-containing protein [Planctomycetota bacterium]|nr:MAG: carboxypeptidase regulatory-like domain-containing protein [Planctomycetota bacterium]
MELDLKLMADSVIESALHPFSGFFQGNLWRNLMKRPVRLFLTLGFAAFILASFITFWALAQYPSVADEEAIFPNRYRFSGIVQDDHHNPIQGASVEILGTGIQATSNVDGEYSLWLSNPEQHFVVLQATAPARGPNFSQAYIPQGIYIPLARVPRVSDRPFIDELLPSGPPLAMQVDPYLEGTANFTLQQRNGWVSEPVGPDGAEMESPNQDFAVKVPAGALDQDSRIVITKLKHESYSLYDDMNENAWVPSGLQFEVVLIDDQNQVRDHSSFAQMIEIEIRQESLQVFGQENLYWDLEGAAVVDHASASYLPQAGVKIRWNPAQRRYVFSLPHFSCWTCPISDQTLGLRTETNSSLRSAPTKARR